MKAIGIDLGGTKIEVQLYADDWSLAEARRVATPGDYDGLVAALADQVGWGRAQGGDLPVGVAAAGLVHPGTGAALTANLPASGRPLPGDLRAAAGGEITYINDCRALALSEAAFGAGRAHRGVAALIMGTGVGGGFAYDGHLLDGPSTTGGEFGHTALPAAWVQSHGLPLHRCGCGRMGCLETYLAGPGLSRLARELTGRAATPPEIAAARREAFAPAWGAWCALAAEALRMIALTLDPDIVVLGGGLSQIDGVVADIEAALDGVRLGDFPMPQVALAEGGAASGGRGAALAAWQAAEALSHG